MAAMTAVQPEALARLHLAALSSSNTAEMEDAGSRCGGYEGVTSFSTTPTSKSGLSCMAGPNRRLRCSPELRNEA